MDSGAALRASDLGSSVHEILPDRGHLRIRRRDILWHRSVRRTEHNKQSQAIKLQSH